MLPSLREFFLVCLLCAGPKRMDCRAASLASYASLQDGVQIASKQARLEREEADVVSTSLPTHPAATFQVDAQIRASVAAAGGLDATDAGAQPGPTSADQPDAQLPQERGAEDLFGDSSMTKVLNSRHKQNQGALTSFLGDYGSDSDDNKE